MKRVKYTSFLELGSVWNLFNASIGHKQLWDVNYSCFGKSKTPKTSF